MSLQTRRQQTNEKITIEPHKQETGAVLCVARLRGIAKARPFRQSQTRSATQRLSMESKHSTKGNEQQITWFACRPGKGLSTGPRRSMCHFAAQTLQTHRKVENSGKTQKALV